MSEDNRGRVVRVSGGNGDTWDWQQELRPQRSGVPLFGIFLILLGLFLIVNTYVPVAQLAGSVFFLAVGLLLLGLWVRDRGHAALYLGAIFTALSLADVLTVSHVLPNIDGWGRLFLGIAFLAIAAIRGAGGAGWGWQLVVGVVLTVAGGADVAAYYGSPDLSRFAVPLLLILLGAWVITRERTFGRR